MIVLFEGVTVFMYLPLSPLLKEAVTIELAFTPLTVNASEALVPIVKVPNLNVDIVVPPERFKAPAKMVAPASSAA